MLQVTDPWVITWVLLGVHIPTSSQFNQSINVYYPFKLDESDLQHT